MQFSKNFLEQIVPGALCVSGNCPPDFCISYEIQSASKGDIFFVLIHEESSFPEIIKMALCNQVAGVIISTAYLAVYQQIAIEQKIPSDFFVMSVRNVEHALYNIANYIKEVTKKTVIAISGISGARQAVAVLSEIIKAQGIRSIAIFHDQSRNIALDVAKFIINYRHEQVVIIFEAKVIKRYDMEILTQATQPTYAIITSVGQHSVDTIGSVQDVAAEYRAIFSLFSEKNIGIVNGDQIPLAAISYPHPVMKFGLKVSNQVQARKVRIKHSATYFVLKIYRNKYQIKIATTHREQLLATLAAIAAAKLLMIPDAVIVSTIQKEFIVPECFEKKIVYKITDGMIIDDFYTNDPENVKLSLSAFHALETTQPKIIVLGDMPGLGIHSAFWHRQIGRFLRKLPEVTAVFVVGSKGNFIKLTAPKTMYIELIPSAGTLKEELTKFNGQKPIILVKGTMSQEIKTFISQLSNQSVTS